MIRQKVYPGLIIPALCVLVATSLAILGKPKKVSFRSVAELVRKGDGKIYTVPDLVVGSNFKDYPASFDRPDAISAWNLDIIDTEKLANNSTGEGVYVAILDSGLKRNWRDYFPEERIAADLGRSFVDIGVMKAVLTGRYVPKVVESASFTGEVGHGTHIAGAVVGYSLFGFLVEGVAPGASIIPVKVLNSYEGIGGVTFGTDAALAAGIDYITSLALENPQSRFVVNMSLGALTEISDIERTAVDAALAAGVVVVAAAGNSGVSGLESPGSYPPVISVGASGWAFDPLTCSGEWASTSPSGDCLIPAESWWLGDVPEDSSADTSYITSFSSRVNPSLVWDQELDLVAPGSWVLGPFPEGPGQSHLPWWSWGWGKGVGGQYFFIGGTSLSTPHVSGVAALVLQARPGLSPSEVEAILTGTADSLPFLGVRTVIGEGDVSWGLDGLDAVGAGLVQADAAVEAALTVP